ncbi:unnamed protein product, partial [marine sediment metagenome]
RLVILIFILFLISPLVISTWIIPTTLNFARNDYQEESTKNKIEKPKISNGNGWILDGLDICTAIYWQWNPQICSDGQGGAIITWDDKRNGGDLNIYAQKVDSNGYVQWLIDGVPVSTAGNDQMYPQICSDGAGGAIIIWFDYRSGSKWDIYAQRIDSNGNILWNNNGSVISTALNTLDEPQICSDGAGGAIFTWRDYRSGNSDIYAQRIGSNGNIQWIDNGTALCTVGSDQYNPQICSEEAGGAIITWYGRRNGSSLDIYAQKIDSIGNVKWNANGTA